MADVRYRLFHGDCLDILPTLEAGSVDAIITDLPYGTTACSWDEVIPFAPMWAEVKRVLKPRGAFVTTASQPFTSKLIASNLQWFKYELIWDKKLPTGFLDANRKPMKQHENICVFCEGQSIYNPQFSEGKRHGGGTVHRKNKTEVYGSFADRVRDSTIYFPVSIIRPKKEPQSSKIHPTQKPVALYEYLIRTYTNEGDVVLDFTMGSGTTGVAAMNTGRRFVGVEMDAGYYAIAQERIGNAAGDYRATAKEEARGMRALFW